MKKIAIVLALAATGLFGSHAGRPAAQRLPNVIVIYADDLGYADIGPFSTRGSASPRVRESASPQVRESASPQVRESASPEVRRPADPTGSRRGNPVRRTWIAWRARASA